MTLHNGRGLFRIFFHQMVELEKPAVSHFPNNNPIQPFSGISDCLVLSAVKIINYRAGVKSDSWQWRLVKRVKT